MERRARLEGDLGDSERKQVAVPGQSHHEQLVGHGSEVAPAEHPAADDQSEPTEHVHAEVLNDLLPAGALGLGQLAIVRSGIPGQQDEPDQPGEQGHDASGHEEASEPGTFSWEDAAHWSPGKAAAGQLSERQYAREDLDELFGEQPNDEVGSVDELPWYGLVKHDGRPGGFLLHEDTQGFRRVHEAETAEALAQAWSTVQHEYEQFYEERAAYERATEDAERADFDRPRVWVAGLADYVDGRLRGVWMDATCEPEELQAATRFMLRGSREAGAEEWGIFDHEGFYGYRLGSYSASVSGVT